MCYRRAFEHQYENGTGVGSKIGRCKNETAFRAQPPHPAKRAASVIKDDAVFCPRFFEPAGGLLNRSFPLKENYILVGKAHAVVQESVSRHAPFAPRSQRVLAKAFGVTFVDFGLDLPT